MPYQVALYQIINLLSLSIINTIYLIVFRPLKESNEFQKQISYEMFLAVTQLLLAILAADDLTQVLNQNERLIIDWCLIASISAILCIQLAIDFMQQWRLILKSYKSMKKLVQLIMKKSKSLTNPPPKLAEALIFQ